MRVAEGEQLVLLVLVAGVDPEAVRRRRDHDAVVPAAPTTAATHGTPIISPRSRFAGLASPNRSPSPTTNQYAMNPRWVSPVSQARFTHPAPIVRRMMQGKVDGVALDVPEVAELC